jgi:hypothetical protein
MPYLKSSMSKISLSFILVLLCLIPGIAQELNCVVTINASQVPTSDRGIFDDMKTAVEQFMNGRKWTNDSYKIYEKVNCNMLITITKMPAIGNFSASVQIQSARPVYSSNYPSLIFNFADRDWEFE